MKKLLIGAILTIGLVGCIKSEDDKNINDPWTNHGNGNFTRIAEIEGHKYIIFDGYRAGNIIHAASCNCMNK